MAGNTYQMLVCTPPGYHNRDVRGDNRGATNVQCPEPKYMQAGYLYFNKKGQVVGEPCQHDCNYRQKSYVAGQHVHCAYCHKLFGGAGNRSANNKRHLNKCEALSPESRNQKVQRPSQVPGPTQCTAGSTQAWEDPGTQLLWHGRASTGAAVADGQDDAMPPEQKANIDDERVTDRPAPPQPQQPLAPPSPPAPPAPSAPLAPPPPVMAAALEQKKANIEEEPIGMAASEPKPTTTSSSSTANANQEEPIVMAAGEKCNAIVQTNDSSQLRIRAWATADEEWIPSKACCEKKRRGMLRARGR